MQKQWEYDQKRNFDPFWGTKWSDNWASGAEDGKLPDNYNNILAVGALTLEHQSPSYRLW